MNAAHELHNLGQSLWLDNITRTLLTSGTLSRYIREFAVTGPASNPSIFDLAIKSAGSYDDAIRKKADEGKSGESLFFEHAAAVYEAKKRDAARGGAARRPALSRMGRQFRAGACVPCECGMKARPSGMDDIYKIYVASFRGEQHLRRIAGEAQAIVDKALAVDAPAGGHAMP